MSGWFGLCDEFQLQCNPLVSGYVALTENPSRPRAPLAPEEIATVWILGAGASLSATKGFFPTLLGFPAKAKALEIAGIGSFPALSRYLRSRHFHTLGSSKAPLNLESVLTLLETDIAVAPRANLQTAHEEIIKLLRNTLTELHRLYEKTGEPAGEYERLRKELQPQDTVITFNWDILLDDVMGRRDCLPRDSGNPSLGAVNNAYSRFLLSSTGWGDGTVELIGPRGPSFRRDRKGEYIKAHGSIDWFYCTNETCRQDGITFPLLKYSRIPRCAACVERMRPLIVPPTLNKRVRELRILRRSWALAAYELSMANRVILWGYSLPPTDFFSEWLLRQARGEACRELIIINPDITTGKKKKPQLNKDFIRRFTSAVWKPKNVGQVRLYRTFGEYLSLDDLTKVEPSLRSEIVALVGG